MTNHFHRTLNRMAFFTALLLCGLILFFGPFMRIATANLYLNGIIIGTTLFGMGLCFAEMFHLLPEYRWVRAYFRGDLRAKLPPRLLRPVAIMLRRPARNISAGAIQSMLEMILIRFEDARESMRYVTNTLIFLGLLGTFWGLIMTVGGFAELVGVLNFDDPEIMNTLQNGLATPLAGMGTAFTSSLLGLGGSLTVGFLALQVQLAQGAIFRELEEHLATYSSVSDTAATATLELSQSIEQLRRAIGNAS